MIYFGRRNNENKKLSVSCQSLCAFSYAGKIVMIYNVKKSIKWQNTILLHREMAQYSKTSEFDWRI